MSIAFRMSPDVDIKKRSTYTILDLLGDVGGLFDALKASGSVIVAIYFVLRGNPLEKYLLETIFKSKINATKRVSDLKKL